MTNLTAIEVFNRIEKERKQAKKTVWWKTKKGQNTRGIILKK